MIRINPAVLFPTLDRKALIVGVLIASDRISNTFLPRRACDTRVPAHKCQKIRTRSEEIIVFALRIDCRSPFYREEENHLDVARSSLRISSICDDAIPFRTIDKSEEPRTKNVHHERYRFRAIYMCVSLFGTI